MNKIKIESKSLIVFFALFLLVSFDCYSQEIGTKSTVIRGGITLGSVLAVVLSWERNKSVLLAFIHGIFSFLYVFYFLLTRKPEERK